MFGNYLKRFRLKKHMSQKELAKNLSISPSMLSRIENGKIVAPNYVLSRFKGVFQFILTDEDYNEIYLEEHEKVKILN